MTDNTKRRNLIAYRISEDGSYGPMNVRDDLAALQDAVRAEYIDIVGRCIGPERRSYAIVCDDVGGLNGRDVTAIHRNNPVLAGDLLVLRNGGEGDLESLTDDDLDYISCSMKKIWSYTDHVVVRSVLELV